MSEKSQTSPQFDAVRALCEALGLSSRSVVATLDLLGGGATVPFIARYRKEATGGLDEVQIRAIEERNGYLVALEARRAAIIESLREQDKLTDLLYNALKACTHKAALEDLYLPYKPKRRTRATVARERGLEPLAERILAQPTGGSPKLEAARFVDVSRDVPDVEAALAGARDIVAERVAERADVRAMLREGALKWASIASKGIQSKIAGPTRFQEYYTYKELVSTIPSHRYLAVCRGEEEGVLRVSLDLDEEAACGDVLRLAGLRPASAWAGELRAALEDGFKRLLMPATETAVRAALKERSDKAAVEVFAENLRDLLLAPPLGARPVLGLDPGLRTGCKCAALDGTGALLGHVTLFPTQGETSQQRAARDLLAFIERFAPEVIALGNGTGSRETEAFVRATLGTAGLGRIPIVVVNESGASVYSASELARATYPDLDVTVRGAISIGHRLQDPLAELVQIEPKSIGVGQYQHDVKQALLDKKLGEVVEDCVHEVGVELNTASASLLSHVSGIGPAVARNLVKRRNERGPFRTRRELMDVPGLGPRAFELCAGFLRLRDGEQPLDASAVHPERYELVERMARDLGVGVARLVGNAALAGKIEVKRYEDATVGAPTLRDIVAELARPGRDPREHFQPPRRFGGIKDIKDLKPGMVLEGTVTNVAAFGAFVDIGVHQDGLVHISELSDRFVKDPRQVARVGQVLEVRVLGVDLPRRRIALSARRGT